MAHCLGDRAKNKAKALYISVLALVGTLALLGIGWERVASGTESGMRILTSENNNKKAADKTTPPKMRRTTSGNGNNNPKSGNAVARNNKAVADHEWKTTPRSNPDIDADATERSLYRKCPPGVDSVTGSFCGLSYEQICCFCPQPLDCESDGCPADADGVVRDGCFHSITIPCPDVDCGVDMMTDRAVELGG